MSLLKDKTKSAFKERGGFGTTRWKGVSRAWTESVRLPSSGFVKCQTKIIIIKKQ